LPPSAWLCVEAECAVLHLARMEHKSDATIHVRLEPELRSQLEEIARAEDRPLSSLVRRVLREAARRSDGEREAAA
jgi:predicted HicB family RNase H-like nuclease